MTVQGPPRVLPFGGPSPFASWLQPVPRNAELERVLALPYVPLTDRSEHPAVSTLALPGATWELWEEQRAALSDAAYLGGLFAPLAVGGGKTLVAFLLPVILGASRPLILTTAAMVRESSQLMAEYRTQFRSHPALQVMSYNVLSHPKATASLETMRPDLIVLDEAQSLANREAARTGRFLRYLRSAPDTKVCVLSGSVTRRSLLDYGHLLALALHEHAPVPLDWPTLTQWSEALDVDSKRPPGALTLLPGATPREGFRNRLTNSRGVVASTASSYTGTVRLITLPRNAPSVTRPIRENLKTLRTEWRDPAGEELVSATEVAAQDRAIRQGGYYVWRWSEPTERQTEYLAARSAWSRELRQFLAHRRRTGLDSPALVSAVIAGGPGASALYPHVRHLAGPYEAWASARDSIRAPSPAWEWFDSSVAEWAANYLLQREPGRIVWSTIPEVGRGIAHLAGVPYFGQGAHGILTHTGPCVASIAAHGTGRNLQRYYDALVIGAPTQGAQWEQLIGRHARPGQVEPVTFSVLSRFTDDLRTAVRDARYIQETTGNAQLILRAMKGVTQ